MSMPNGEIFETFELKEIQSIHR